MAGLNCTLVVQKLKAVNRFQVNLIASIAPQWYRNLVWLIDPVESLAASIAPQWYRNEGTCAQTSILQRCLNCTLVVQKCKNGRPGFTRNWRLNCTLVVQKLNFSQELFEQADRLNCTLVVQKLEDLRKSTDGLKQASIAPQWYRNVFFTLHLLQVFGASIAPQWYRNLRTYASLRMGLSSLNCTLVVQK